MKIGVQNRLFELFSIFEGSICIDATSPFNLFCRLFHIIIHFLVKAVKPNQNLNFIISGMTAQYYKHFTYIILKIIAYSSEQSHG